MPRKSVRPTHSRAMASASEGMMAGLVDRVFENPATSGGLMVVALTATAIISNAMFLQNTHHPDSMFSNRVTAPTADAVPLPAVAPIAHVDQPAKVPPLPRPSPARLQQAMPPVLAPPTAPAAAAAPPSTTNSKADQAALITAVQRELARLGIYSGAIDGRPGSRTAAAISAYEKAAGLAVTGHATAALLATMKAPLPPAPIAAAPVVPVAAAPADPIGTAAAADLDARTDARQATIAEQQQERADAQMHADYRAAQSALNNIGYGPLTVNGQPDAETSDAIRRFELDNGMPISGQATAAVIARLTAIGAIKPG